MNIENVALKNFRNIEKMDLSFGSGVNVICGGNAQGKTNILESLWLFTGARSFRGRSDVEFIRFGEETASINMRFYAAGREQEASISFSENKKLVLLNGIKKQSAGLLAGEFCSVLFSPDHLSLVKQGPENRRRMLDVSLCQAYPKYSRILDSYQKILKQRAAILRDIPHRASLMDLLDAWDKSLVDYGSYIAAVRTGYIKRLAVLARDVYSGISQEKEELGVYYKNSFAGDISTEGFKRKDFAAVYEIAVADSRKEDIAVGRTTLGPHRDDLEIEIDAKPVRSFGSQGQQRSCVLALKLAECGILEERNGEPPVVLLDDVMSELDKERQEYLLSSLKGRQTVITCCDASSLNLGSAGMTLKPIRGDDLRMMIF